MFYSGTPPLMTQRAWTSTGSRLHRLNGDPRLGPQSHAFFSEGCRHTQKRKNIEQQTGSHVAAPFLHIARLVGGFERLLTGCHRWSLHPRGPSSGSWLCSLPLPLADTIIGGFTPRASGSPVLLQGDTPTVATGDCGIWVLFLLNPL